MKRISTILILCTLIIGVGLLAFEKPPAAYAHDHQVPQATLNKAKQELQSGYLVGEYSWSYPSGDGTCASEQALLETRFPAAKSVKAGSKLRVRIFKAHRPSSFEVTAYRAVDRNGIPTGKKQSLRRTLKPVIRAGQTVAWDAVFHANRPNRHYYLVTEGHWQDRQGCSADQFAFWSFHVKTGGV